jgi:undecaprenyl-diphosphatase
VKPSGLVVAAAALGWVVYKRKEIGKVEAGFWVVVAAVGVLYGLGVIAPPNFEKIVEHIGSTLGKWTYLLVGALAFLETGAFVGLIAPGETTILLGGFVAGQGKISLVLLLAIVWACALAGDVTSYFLGRRLGRDFLVRHGPKVKITEDRLEKVEGFFQKYGGSAILLGRFVGLVRAVAPFIAGSSRLPFRRFIVFDVIGTGIWGCGLVILGYVFWQSFDKLLKFAKQGILALAIVICLVVGIIAAVRWIRDEENRRQAREFLEARAIGRVVILPAARLGMRLVPSLAAIQLATLTAIGLVGGFTFFALGSAVQNGVSFHTDTVAADMARDLRTDTVVSIAKVFTNLGSLPAIELITFGAVMFLIGRRYFAEAVAIGIGGIFVVVANHVAKAAIDRPRPAGGLISADGSSYPSGHATYSIAWIAVAVAVARASPGWARRTGLIVASLAIAFLIGASRVYLGVHYGSDVTGGWGLGLACYSICGLVVVAVAFLRQNGEHAAATPEPEPRAERQPQSDPSPS